MRYLLTFADGTSVIEEVRGYIPLDLFKREWEGARVEVLASNLSPARRDLAVRRELVSVRNLTLSEVSEHGGEPPTDNLAPEPDHTIHVGDGPGAAARFIQKYGGQRYTESPRERRLSRQYADEWRYGDR